MIQKQDKALEVPGLLVAQAGEVIVIYIPQSLGQLMLNTGYNSKQVLESAPRSFSAPH
jgi:hypothetical protein